MVAVPFIKRDGGLRGNPNQERATLSRKLARESKVQECRTCDMILPRC
jgi:hypothetical protein